MPHPLTIFIALVWLINGLLCKLLNLVPRHRQIVTELLTDSSAILYTSIIGSGEVLLALCILLAKRSLALSILQITLVATMNIMESILVPHLLLFGRWNALPALAFIILIWYHHKHINLKSRPYAIPA